MITVKDYSKTIVHIKGEQKTTFRVQNTPQKIRIVQSASPIPLTVGESPTIDGGNF